MPITFSHPALILPIYLARRYYFSLTGLVIGSIAPDFEYFIRMKAKSIYSHTFLGIFWFNLPLALLLSFVFHNLIRNPLVKHLPLPLFQRFSIYQDFRWDCYLKSNWGAVIISILIGTGSHLLWDWFTHTGVTFFTTSIRTDLNISVDHFLVKYIIFHLVNSLAGGIVLWIAIFKLPVQHTDTRTQYRSWYWWIIVLFTMMICVIRLNFDTSIVLYDIAVDLLAAFLLALTMVSLLLKFT
jgi:hypothetical protein